MAIPSQIAPVSDAEPVSRTAPRLRLASPTTAVVLAVLTALLVVAVVVLSRLSRESGTGSPLFIAFALPFAVVGLVVARRQPQNAIGWILSSVAGVFLLIAIGRTYSVLDYRVHQGSLPLGWLAVSLTEGWTPLFLLMPLPLLLFPAGKVPSRRWRWSLWMYLVVGGLLILVALAGGISIGVGRHVHIDSTGMPTNNLSGFFNALNGAANVGELIVLVLALTWIVRLLASYRRARGDSRQQLKWLLAGGALTIVGVMLGALGPSGPASGIVAVLLTLLIFLGFVSLPLALGLGVLKYRLYDIDRLISRTLSYAIVTGLLVGVYIGVVTLATRVLPFSSPLGVAASTLAAVALFNPLRRRVQRLVDRRFNRARYDAEAMVAAFARRVRDDVNLEVVSSEFVRAVQISVEPAQVSLWLRPTGSRS
jgi:hypothetical protein